MENPEKASGSEKRLWTSYSSKTPPQQQQQEEQEAEAICCNCRGAERESKCKSN